MQGFFFVLRAPRIYSLKIQILDLYSCDICCRILFYRAQMPCIHSPIITVLNFNTWLRPGIFLLKNVICRGIYKVFIIKASGALIFPTIFVYNKRRIKK